jgi:hypothetical protein
VRPGASSEAAEPGFEAVPPLPPPPPLLRGRSVSRRAGGRRRRAPTGDRLVGRVVRHVDPWSVLKLSLVLYLVVFAIVLTAGVVLWYAASAAGVIHRIERTVKELWQYQSFSLRPLALLRAAGVGGAVLVVVGTGFNVLAAVVFNLVSDLVGGIRVEVVEKQPRRALGRPR